MHSQLAEISTTMLKDRKIDCETATAAAGECSPGCGRSGVVVAAAAAARLPDSPKQICVISAAAADHHHHQQQQRQTMTPTAMMTTSTIEKRILTAGKRTLFSALRSYQYVTSGFYKFLARFSGRRRHLGKKHHALVLHFMLILILSTLCNKTDACSSRTTPKPRPSTPTPRPNITFHTYKCPQAYADWYCLNEATCFTVKIGDSLLYNCECADGYMGPRCEYKNLDGTYLPTRPSKMLETASIYSGALVAFVIAIVLLAYVAVTRHRNRKLSELEGDLNGMDIGDSTATGLDTVDGYTVARSYAMPLNSAMSGNAGPLPPRSQNYSTNGHQQQKRYPCPMRPFGPHHHQTIPMSKTLSTR